MHNIQSSINASSSILRHYFCQSFSIYSLHTQLHLTPIKHFLLICCRIQHIFYTVLSHEAFTEHISHLHSAISTNHQPEKPRKPESEGSWVDQSTGWWVGSRSRQRQVWARGSTTRSWATHHSRSLTVTGARRFSWLVLALFLDSLRRMLLWLTRVRNIWLCGSAGLCQKWCCKHNYVFLAI